MPLTKQEQEKLYKYAIKDLNNLIDACYTIDVSVKRRHSSGPLQSFLRSFPFQTCAFDCITYKSRTDLFEEVCKLYDKAIDYLSECKTELVNQKSFTDALREEYKIND